MAPRETENNAYANFGVTNKEHYGMLWYFLEWSIREQRQKYKQKQKSQLILRSLGMDMRLNGGTSS